MFSGAHSPNILPIYTETINVTCQISRQRDTTNAHKQNWSKMNRAKQYRIHSGNIPQLNRKVLLETKLMQLKVSRGTAFIIVILPLYPLSWSAMVSSVSSETLCVGWHGPIAYMSQELAVAKLFLAL